MPKNLKDWTGNYQTVFAALGASSHSKSQRQRHDYYATEPIVIDELFQVEIFNQPIWECACGEGHLAKRMKKHGKQVLATDLIDRSYGNGCVDFLETSLAWNGDIITNPPYKFAKEFVEKAIQVIGESKLPDLKVAMFLKLTFLEGKKRYLLFKQHPPRTIYVYSSRRKCAMNGDFAQMKSSAVCYAWFVWEKSHKGKTVVKWIR